MSSWRISRLRPAPSAVRTANSPRRRTPRASSKLVTFTHAMTNTSRTAPTTASSAGFTPRVTSSCSEFTMNPCLWDSQGGLGNSSTGVRTIASSSRLA